MVDNNDISGKGSAGGVVAIVIVVFISIALYNVLELNFHIFSTFKKRGGLYFWGLLIATWGIAPNAIGYLLKHLALTNISNLYATLIIIGWCTMVTGQSVVLYSRLRLLTRNVTTLRAVLTMIIFNAVVLHIPVIVLVYGSNSANPGPFIGPYSVYEKLQLTVFFIQETIISGLYIWEATKLLKAEGDIRGETGSNRAMNHLIYVNYRSPRRHHRGSRVRELVQRANRLQAAGIQRQAEDGVQHPQSAGGVDAESDTR
ncbi:integral membrane protein [Fusarium austroafricanum]|uniref:Integral membrane protein n=1 Tax=Fusarium austroafricanum TaxID=2364996 RepID=A0A8H4NT93_9HYPO|nr:integral membrane protein [Fusarium austroafricanum]